MITTRVINIKMFNAINIAMLLYAAFVVLLSSKYKYNTRNAKYCM